MTKPKNPRTSSTGVVDTVEKSFAYSIDWLRFSVSCEVSRESILPPWEEFEWQGETAKPFPNYNKCAVLGVGRIDWHTEELRQKQLVTMTGRDLRELVRRGRSVPELVACVASHETLKVSRLDFAVDVFNAGASPRALHLQYRRGKCKTRARSSAYFVDYEQSAQRGHTAYIGNRESEKYLRCYDKALEQGVDGDWKRIEIETKDKYARVMLASMERHGVVEGGKVVIRQYIVTGLDWFDDSVADGFTGAYVDKVPDDHDGHLAWVMNVALPAVEEEVKKGDQTIISRLIKAIDSRSATNEGRVL